MNKYRHFIFEIIGFIIYFQVVLLLWGGGERHGYAIILGLLYFFVLTFYYSNKYIDYLKQEIDRDKIKKIIIIRICRTLIFLIPIIPMLFLNIISEPQYSTVDLELRAIILEIIAIVCIILRVRSLLIKLKKVDDL